MDGVTAATMQVFPFADHSCVMCGRDEIRSEASKSRIRVDATATRILPVQGVAKPAIPTILETIAQSLMVFATCERKVFCLRGRWRERQGQCCVMGLCGFGCRVRSTAAGGKEDLDDCFRGLCEGRIGRCRIAWMKQRLTLVRVVV